LGVDIRLPAVSPQPYTRRAFEGLEFAKDKGAGDAYNSAVMRAFFQRSEDIGRLEVLCRVAAEAGLSTADFVRALETRAYADRVERLLHQARVEVGVTAVPLFVIGHEKLTGLQPYALEAAIERQLSSIKDSDDDRMV
jgi:predicted DsbA family dithiol-disulfide isomerase